MKTLINKLHGNKKGFTLVELIVVLVILAILAALLVPALTGYIDRARNSSLKADTRSAVLAAQTLVSEAYGRTPATDITVGTADTATVKIDDVKALAEVKGTISAVTVAKASTDAKNAGKITALSYTLNSVQVDYTFDTTTNTATYKIGTTEI